MGSPWLQPSFSDGPELKGAPELTLTGCKGSGVGAVVTGMVCDGKSWDAPADPILRSLHKLPFSNLAAGGHEEYSEQPH